MSMADADMCGAFFSSQNNNSVCDVCGGTMRFCGSNTNLVKHLEI